jgi:glyceraldehyde-3-phosphate dehydrogenase/erythrose-4-phosphate dehydrogenase
MSEDNTGILIVGYGNVGRGVHEAIKRNSDMNLVGIVSRDPSRVLKELRNNPIPIFDRHSIKNIIL